MKTVLDILKENPRPLIMVSPQQNVLEAIHLLADRDVGAALVMNHLEVAGVLSERDYARKVTLMNRLPESTLVSEIMSQDVVMVHPKQSAEDCLKIMGDLELRHLPVVEDKKVLGFISILDVAKSLIYEKKQIIRSLESYVAQSWPF